MKNVRDKYNLIELTTGLLALHSIFWLFTRTLFPISGPHTFRQAQTNWPVKVWATEGFVPFQPEVPVKGPEHFSWLLELPIFQWIVYFLHQSTNIPIDYASRITGLFFALGTVAIFAFLISKQYQNSFNLNLLIFLFNPYFIYWSTTGLIDWAAVFLGSLAGFIICSKNFKTKEQLIIFWPLLFLSLGAMIKPSHAILAFCFSLSITITISLKKIKIQKKKIISTFTVLTGGISFGLIWTLFINKKYDISDPRHIWVVSDATRNWYFGSQEQYSNILSGTWKLITQTLQNNLGTYILMSAVLVSIYKLKSSVSSLAIFFGVFIYLCIFINLNVIHTYYQIPVYLGLTILILIGISNLKNGYQTFLVVPIVFIYLFQINFNSSVSGETSQYLDLVRKRTDIMYVCPKFISIEKPILTFQQENPYHFYFCGIKSLMVTPGSSVDYEMARKYQDQFDYVYARDSDMYKKAELFLNKFDKKMLSTSAEGYFKVE